MLVYAFWQSSSCKSAANSCTTCSSQDRHSCLNPEAWEVVECSNVSPEGNIFLAPDWKTAETCSEEEKRKHNQATADDG